MESTCEIETIFWIGTTIVLMLVFAMLFMALFYQRSFAKAKKNEAEVLLKIALESEKNERARIAKDLHDSVQSDLSAIRNYMERYKSNKKDTSDFVILNHINESIIQTIENTRQITYNLMPPILEILGFSATIQNYFDILKKSNHLTLEFHDKSLGLEVSKDCAYELYRIIQEFTTNMLKYGNVQEFRLILYELQGSLVLELIDDGKPFDFKKQYQKSKGSGLQNIQSRLNSISARLEQKKVHKGNHFVIFLK
jgi:signal transduction histidine kinase